MSRLTLNDTADEIIMKLTDNNPVAIQILIIMMNNSINVDPKLGPMATLAPCLWLDTYEIYGDDIVKFCHALCESDVAKMHVILRGIQLGVLRKEDLKLWMADPSVAWVNHAKILGLVQEQLKQEVS